MSPAHTGEVGPTGPPGEQGPMQDMNFGRNLVLYVLLGAAPVGLP